jgi:protein TonB
VLHFKLAVTKMKDTYTLLALSGLLLMISVSKNPAFGQSTQTNTAQEKSASQAPESKPKSDERVFLVVEQPPEFQGGKMAMQKFITDNLIVPTSATSKKLSGKVFVSFIVNADGSLEDIALKKGLSPEQDKEALRIVGLMPSWKPGYQSGKAMRVIYLLPIEFR